ncbi:diguanylate cyclase (GGDEF)-like protein [Tahibacter aquaticus]|uniref:diguanylate cyclase n=2 Tax=Tahibacter aquaticus TaxID=520092 RepID=A0A4R6Z703_9GAMM|nr:diguanylate cyclase (GGDEF)-like protein [Tahibacter aquaticus]
MLLDVRTAMLLTSAITLVLSLCLAFTVRQSRRPAALASRLWALGTALQPLGWLLLGLRGHIPDLFSVVCGNGLICLAYAQYPRALAAFNSDQRPSQLPNLLAASTLVPVAFYTWLEYNVQMRTVITSGLLLALFVLTLREIHRGAVRALAGQHILAATFAIGAGLLLVRMVFETVNPAPLTSALAATPMQSALFGYAALAPVVATFAFFQISSDRQRLELETLAATDPLTGVLNRRMLDQLVAGLLAESRRHGRPLSVLLLDADRFKDINDAHGHHVGDFALRALVHAVRELLRPGDLIGRLGGEEFLVVLNATAESEAVLVAERLRASVAALDLRQDDARLALSVSIGVATLSPECSDFNELVRSADHAMYAAKRGGRNRVVSGEFKMRQAMLDSTTAD